MPAAGAVAFILKGYPRLSETFIAQEIHGLERLGLDIHIYSLRPPREAERHPINARIAAPVTYLPERLGDDWGRVLRALGRCAARPGFAGALRLWAADMIRFPSPDRIRRFGQALVLADELDASIDRLHAHFLHTPASVARYASALTGKSWSCSAHARDIWTISAREKRVKLADMDWLVTCTASGRDHLRALAPDPDKVELAYHGLDLARFPPPPAQRPPRDGSRRDDPVRLLSVGRAVEKKGFDLLLEALAGLPGNVHWHWIHIGEGDALTALKAQADRLGLADRIEWLGSRAQGEVIEQYRRADLFVLPCRIAADGDRDGLPNVLIEAQSQELACLSTDMSAIPELIADGQTGVLVPPGDVPALGAALARLIVEPSTRTRLGRAGAVRVARDFTPDAGLERLARRFGLPPAAHHARPAA